MNMNFARINFLAALALWFFATGCASVQQTEDIEVSLVNLTFESATVLETTAVFTIRIQNQRPMPLLTEGSVHKIYLNNVSVGSGVSNESVELARLSEGTHTLRVRLHNLAMARLFRDIMEQRRVDYRLESMIYARSEGRATKLRVKREGALDVRDFQPTRPPTN